MDIDADLLEAFENGLNPAFPDKSTIAPEILGYGEISSTFSIPGMPRLAFKRMPPFYGGGAIADYRSAVGRYCALLADRCGIRVAPVTLHDLINRRGEHIVYVAQPRLPAGTIGNRQLAHQRGERLDDWLQPVVQAILGVWQYNRSNDTDARVGIDGQISNWSLEDGRAPVYFDVTTPLYRVNGAEQLDPEIFLKSCPTALVWLVRRCFLQEVLDRYYDTRLVLIDLVANFVKEGRADLIDPAVASINRRLERAGGLQSISPLNRREIDDYYKNDAFIWRVFLSLRRLDRFLKTRLAGGRYNFLLPGKNNR
jgi:hypothetical protein